MMKLMESNRRKSKRLDTLRADLAGSDPFTSVDNAMDKPIQHIQED